MRVKRCDIPRICLLQNKFCLGMEANHFVLALPNGVTAIVLKKEERWRRRRRNQPWKERALFVSSGIERRLRRKEN